MLKVGGYWGRGRYRKRILDMRHLSNGWILIKTENSKSEKDFGNCSFYSTQAFI